MPPPRQPSPSMWISIALPLPSKAGSRDLLHLARRPELGPGQARRLVAAPDDQVGRLVLPAAAVPQSLLAERAGEHRAGSRADAEMGRGDPQRGTCRLPGLQPVARCEEAAVGDEPGRVFRSEAEGPRLRGRCPKAPGPTLVGTDDDALAAEKEQLAVVFLKAAPRLRRRHVGQQLERLPGVVAAVDPGKPAAPIAAGAQEPRRAHFCAARAGTTCRNDPKAVLAFRSMFFQAGFPAVASRVTMKPLWVSCLLARTVLRSRSVKSTAR